jgi:hypothetical protein
MELNDLIGLRVELMFGKGTIKGTLSRSTYGRYTHRVDTPDGNGWRVFNDAEVALIDTTTITCAASILLRT